MKQELLILKCEDKSKWYADLIGCRVPLLSYEDGYYEYKSRDKGGYLNYVDKDDAIIVDIKYE